MLLEELEDVASDSGMDEEVEDQNRRDESRTELPSSVKHPDSPDQSNHQGHCDRSQRIEE